MKSTRLAIPLCALVICTFASPAIADVTLKQKSSGKGPIGGAAEGETTTYIKGLKFRSDQTAGGKQISMLMDAGGSIMTVLNHEKKEAEVYDMTKVAEQIASQISIDDVKTTFTPTGQTRQIAGSSCAVHDVSTTAPIKIANMPMTMSMSGPYCLAKNAPGYADFMNFYKAAAERGFIFSHPAAARAAGGQARAMTETYRKMAELGVPLSMDVTMKMSGEGPMAAIMGKMGNNTFTNEAISLSTEAIADAMFEIPAGYKVKKN
jgi:hypothetical protein